MITSIKIIVPTLNTYLFLPKLINSLKVLTWKDWSLLFVDGESTQKHLNWIKKICLSDSRLNFIKQEKKFKGIYGAMNQGFKTIKDNELVLFWGSDDWAISPRVFEDIISKVINGDFSVTKAAERAEIANSIFFIIKSFLIIRSNT